MTCWMSSGSAEADSGLVGQGGDPLGPQHRWKGAKHAWQAPGRHGRHPVHDHLAPGDLRAVDSHNRYDHHARVGQDLSGPIGLELYGAQGRSEGVAALPQPPRPVELQSSSRLRGVNHERPTGAEHQVVGVGPAGGGGQVMQDHPPCRSSGGKHRAVRCSPPPPVARRRRRGWAEPQPPAGHTVASRRLQAEPGHYQLPRTPLAAPMPRWRRSARAAPGPDGTSAAQPRHGLGGGARPTTSCTALHHRPIGAGASQSSSGSSVRWARMAWSRPGLSGRTEPLGRHRVEGEGSRLAMEASSGSASRRPARAGRPRARGSRWLVCSPAGAVVAGRRPLLGVERSTVRAAADRPWPGSLRSSRGARRISDGSHVGTGRSRRRLAPGPPRVDSAPASASRT